MIKTRYIPKPAVFLQKDGNWQSSYPATIYTKSFTKNEAYENTAAYYILRRYGFFLERTKKEHKNLKNIIKRLAKWLEWRDSK